MAARYPDPNPRRIQLIVLGVVGLILLIILVNSTFVILGPTERGILFKRYTSGLDKETIYQEGLNIVAPWNEMIRYDISEQKMEETMDVLSSNGLSIQVDVAVRFVPLQSELGELYEAFREDYADRLVRSELRSAVRKVIGRYTPEELYSTKRDLIEGEMKEVTNNVFRENHVEMRALLIRSVKLPESIQRAIEEKLNQEQQSLAYQFRLEKEQSEAERKRIEAEGSAAANEIINASLTENLLRMRGIEATSTLAASPNAKVIVIGSSKDGLPIILGNQ